MTPEGKPPLGIRLVLLVLGAAGSFFLMEVNLAGKTAARAPMEVKAPTQPEPVDAAVVAVVAEPAAVDAGTDLATAIVVQEFDDDGGWTDAPVETTVELLDAKGHVAGQSIRFEQPTRNDAGLVAEALTNVMGFARVGLRPGTWKVAVPRTYPDRVEVNAASHAFVLKVAADAGVPVQTP